MVIADKDKRVIWVNGSFERITGYPLKQVEGKKLGSILQGEKTDANTIEQLKIHLKKGLPITTRILNYTKSGDPYFDLEVWVKPVKAHGVGERFMVCDATFNYVAIDSPPTNSRRGNRCVSSPQPQPQTNNCTAQ